MRHWQRLVNDYQDTFSGDSGKAVLMDLMKRSGILSTSMIKGDPQMTAFNEGKRAMVLEILSRCRLTVEDIEKMSRQQDEDQ